MTPTETAQIFYRAAIAAGATPEVAVDAAWRAVRPASARAPNGAEAGALNTGNRRSYRSPLGALLGTYTGHYGQHCARWPRTMRSRREAAEVLAELVAVLAG